ncbi:hypothetical protein [Haliscomenobacter sp.]|uniref:hypothetical protein n=1 Tax=Haliscomenobacter sp. TaxID=2717303 RepID=UPI0033650077
MIEYIDAVAIARPPVQKQMWDGTKFVPVMMYRTPNKLTQDQESWLRKIYGAPGIVQPGRYWHYVSDNGLMDEKIYMMFQLKWAGK